MDEIRFAEMISKIAHELRSPLTSVKGFSATLLTRWDRFSDEQRYELIGSIHHDAERMGRIVSEVLDLARVEAGRLELRPTQVEVSGLVTAVCDSLKALGSDRVRVEVPPDISVMADRDRLLHVIGNLIENALKFSDDDPVVVSASSNGDVTIEVTDSGVGIGSDRLPEIFAGPAPTGGTAAPSGTGLGLYLSKRLVEAHGGTIDAQSEEGRGSTFRVSLPKGSG